MRVPLVLLILFSFVGLIPNLGAADKSETQIFYLSIINFLALVFLLVTKEVKQFNKDKRFKLPFHIIAFATFTLISIVSIIFSINKVESFRILTFVIIYFLSIFNIHELLKHVDAKKYLINIFLSLIIIELFAVYSQYLFDYFNSGGNVILRSQRYSGITGNVNITSFILVFKMPILFYLILKSNKTYKNIFYSILILLITFLIFEVLITRGAILSILLISLIILLYVIYNKTQISSFKLKLIYILLPIMFVTFFNKVSDSSSNAIERVASITESTDRSTFERKIFWGIGLKEFSKRPLIGNGIGSYKLNSIKSYLPYMNQYIVPYHAHNDYIEILAETGILGFISYFSIFLFFLYVLVSKKTYSTYRNKPPKLFFFLALSIIVFIGDSLINFPFSRPVQFIYLALVINTISVFYLADNTLPQTIKFKNKPKITLLFLILISSGLILSSKRLYSSSKDQYLLLGSFNSSSLNISLDQLEEFGMDYPNIAATTIPLKTLKAISYLKKGKLDSVQTLLHKGQNENPFLPISQTYLGYYHYLKGDIDSSLFYSKIAFDKQPNNPVHFAHYIVGLNSLKDSLKIDSAYHKIVDNFKNYDPIIDKIYTTALAGIIDKDEENNFLSKVEERLFENHDPQTKANIYILKLGFKNARIADSLNKEGNKFFQNKQYDLAARSFSEAAELNPLELPYHENAANAYLQISELDKAIEYADYVIKNSKKQSGKSNYIKALAYYEKGDFFNACEQIKLSYENGFNSSRALISAFCR